MSGSKNNLSSPQEWLARARSNLKLAQAEKVKEIYWEDLCFELQQCVEKSIKAVLIFHRMGGKCFLCMNLQRYYIRATN